jgi:hypothetical protein
MARSGIAAPLTLAGIAVLLLAGRALDALTLGEAAARSLGVDPLRLQVLLIAGGRADGWRGGGGGRDHRLCRPDGAAPAAPVLPTGVRPA